MFAGKTSSGIAEFNECVRAGQRGGAFKYVLDRRYNDSRIVTHDGVTLNAETFPIHDISEALDISLDRGYRVVFIDEFQFFANPLRVLALSAAGINCILTALNGDFRAEMFEAVTQIIPHADDIIKHTAVCRECRRPATYTVRLTSETSQVAIGGSETYAVMCRECRSRHIAGILGARSSLSSSA